MRRCAVPVLLFLFSLGSVLAQDPNRSRDDAKREEPQKQAYLYKDTVIRGLKVYNARGEQLGSISDLVISERDGRIIYAAMAYGGVGGVGSKMFAVPWNAMKLDYDDKNSWLVLEADKQRLDSAAGFNQDRWPTEPDPSFPARKEGDNKIKEAARETAKEAKETVKEAKDAITQAQILRTSALSGTAVKNMKGEDLGKISDFLFDPRDGSMVYAALSHGGVAGIGSKLFAVPWSAMKLEATTLKPNERTFVLDMPKSTLEQTEGFDSNRWPSAPNTRLFSKEGAKDRDQKDKNDKDK